MIKIKINQNQGFTLVELVMTMVIIGIMGAVVAPRFFSANVFQSRGFADQVKASLRYAQKMASSQNHFVCVTLATTSITLSLDTIAPGSTHPVATCPGSNLASPSGQPTYTITAHGAVTSGGATSFYFDTLGKPSFATTQTILVSGYATPVTVEAETGYVH